MMDQPAAHEIVSVVREFIEQKVMPELKGHSAFHARVAANALGIVARELSKARPPPMPSMRASRRCLARMGRSPISTANSPRASAMDASRSTIRR